MCDPSYILRSLALRIALLAATLYLVGCAGPRQWTAAELDAVANGGEATANTVLADFNLHGALRQQGDKPAQRRFTYIDRPGSHTLSDLQVKRTETEEERYQRLLGVFSDHFLRAGCLAPVSAIRAEALTVRPAHFRDPTITEHSSVENLALARASIGAIISADLQLAEQHRQQARQFWINAELSDKSRSPQQAHREREWSNQLLYISAQIERNVRILRLRRDSLDARLTSSRQRLRAQLDAEMDALRKDPLQLARARDYSRPFAYAAELQERFVPCGAGDLESIKSHVFLRVVNELLAPLRQPFLKASSTEVQEFTGNTDLDRAFFGEPAIAKEMQRRLDVVTAKREAAQRKAAELRKAEEQRIAEARAALRARRVRENLSPDPESVAVAWARVVAEAAAADPKGTATVFLGMFGTVTYEASGNGYCRIAVSARDERSRRCTDSASIAVSNLRCTRSGSAHQCNFLSTIDSDGRPSSSAESGIFTWRPDGELSVRATSNVRYRIWWVGSGSGSRAGSSDQRSTGEVIREMQEFRCETGVDSKQVCANR